jgi:hypothetical protein
MLLHQPRPVQSKHVYVLVSSLHPIFTDQLEQLGYGRLGVTSR